MPLTREQEKARAERKRRKTPAKPDAPKPDDRTRYYRRDMRAR